MIERTRIKLKNRTSREDIYQWFLTFAEASRNRKLFTDNSFHENDKYESETLILQNIVKQEEKITGFQCVVRTNETEMKLSAVFHETQGALYLEKDTNFNTDPNVDDGMLKFTEKVIEASSEDAGLNFSIEPLDYDTHIERVLKSIASGTASASVPIVIITARQNWELPVDPGWFAERLALRAHVIVINDREQSIKAEKMSEKKIRANGYMSIWIPGSGMPVYYDDSYLENEEKARREITKMLSIQFRGAIKETPCSWEELFHEEKENNSEQDHETKIKEMEIFHEDLMKNAEESVEKWKEKYEEEKKKVTALEAELSRMQELYKNEDDGVFLKKTESDYYDQEIRDTIIRILREAIPNTQTRVSDILKDIINNNETKNKAPEIREDILSAFRKDAEVNDRLKNALTKMGFNITSEKKHYKIVWKEDPRYMITLSKTPSKMRAGTDEAMTLIRTIM